MTGGRTATPASTARGAPPAGRLGAPRERARHPFLALLVAACIPVLLLAAWMAYRAAEQQRRDVTDAARKTVDRVADRVTAEIGAEIAVAEAFALTATLDGPDLPAFQAEAERLAAAKPLWHAVELDDIAGRQLVNTLRPPGSDLPVTADRASFDRVLREGVPVVGGIGPVGPVSGQRLVDLRVPVRREGEIRDVLTIALAPTAVSRILRQSGIPAGWIGVVVDRKGEVIARTEAEERTVGQLASASLRQALAQSPSGSYVGLSLEGVELFTVYETLPEAGGWSVHLGIPNQVLDKPVRRALYGLVGGAVASLLLGGGLAALVSTEIADQRRRAERRAAEALQASEVRAALAIEAAELGAWRWDVRRDVIVGSERCRSLLALPRSGPDESDWPADMFLAAVAAEDRAQVRAAARRSRAEAGPLAVEFRAGDPPRWLRAHGRAVGLAGTEALVGVLADVTAAKRAADARLDLQRRLVQAQEDVQARVARELHDQVGQTVTGLSLGLKGLEAAICDAANAASNREQIRWLRRLTGEIGRDIHNVASDLRPTALEDLGLAEALASYAREWSQRFGIPVDLQVVGSLERGPGPNVGIVIYRVLQEALTNVLKHASAGSVDVVLERRDRELRLIIEDDGVGFEADPAEAGVREGRRRLGLSGMRERLALIGGTLEVESEPGRGTTLFAYIPMLHTEEA